MKKAFKFMNKGGIKMKKMLFFIMLLIMVSAVWGESVILNDGRILQGEIVGKESDHIYLSSDGNIYLIKRNLVNEIKNDGNQPITSIIYRKKDFKKEGINFNSVIEIIPKHQIKEDGGILMSGVQKTYETKLNWKPIMLSVLFGALAWDYFATAGDLNKDIDFYEDMKDIANNDDWIDLYDKQIDKLEKRKTRKIINGSLLSAASVVSFAISFERVEIKASPTSVEIGYKF